MAEFKLDAACPVCGIRIGDHKIAEAATCYGVLIGENEVADKAGSTS